MADSKPIEVQELKRSAAIDIEPGLTADIDYQEDIERVGKLRKTRMPFGSLGQKLALSPRPGYHTHWFNDTPGRIEEKKAEGWTHRQDDEGKPIRRVVGTGRDKGVLYAYAMCIPQIFWEEDQQAKFDMAKQPVDAIKASPVQAKAGMLQRNDQEKFYTPREVTIKTE